MLNKKRYPNDLDMMIALGTDGVVLSAEEIDGVDDDLIEEGAAAVREESHVGHPLKNVKGEVFVPIDRQVVACRQVAGEESCHLGGA